MRTVKLAVTLVYFVFADIQEEIADTIDALKTCSKLLTNSPTVPAICYEYIRRRHRQTPYYQAQSGELSRTARRILTHRPTANEIIGPHCFSGPCQRIKFIVSVKVRIITFLNYVELSVLHLACKVLNLYFQ